MEDIGIDTQVHDEEASVQRIKELFAYEMTEVKLMLAGRFKKFTAEDMKNAGADVIVKSINLQRDLPDGTVDVEKMKLEHLHAKRAGSFALSVQRIEHEKTAQQGISFPAMGMLPRTAITSQVDIDPHNREVRSSHVGYTPSAIQIDFVSPPAIGKKKTVYRAKCAETRGEGISALNGVRLCAKKVVYGAKCAETKMEGISALNGVRLRVKKAVYGTKCAETKIEGVSAPDSVKLCGEIPKINVNELVHQGMQSSVIQRKDICLSLDKPRETVSVMPRRLSPVVFQRTEMKTPAIEKMVSLKCVNSADIPAVQADLAMRILPNPHERFSVGEIGNGPDVRNSSKLNLSTIPERVEYTPPRCSADVKCSLPQERIEAGEVLSHTKIAVKRPQLGVLSIEGFAPKLAPVKLPEIKADTSAAKKIPIAARRAEFSGAPQVMVVKMNAPTVADVSGMIKQVQDISRSVIPRGMTYEEMCRRCVVPIRTLDYQGAISAIVSSYKAANEAADS